MTHAEACICLYRPVVVVPAFAGGRKCGGACQPAGAGGSAPLFVPRGGNRLVAEGVMPVKPYSGKLNLRMPSELHARIAAYAAGAGTTINEFINRAIRHELEREGAF